MNLQSMYRQPNVGAVAPNRFFAGYQSDSVGALSTLSYLERQAPQETPDQDQVTGFIGNGGIKYTVFSKLEGIFSPTANIRSSSDTPAQSQPTAATGIGGSDEARADAVVRKLARQRVVLLAAKYVDDNQREEIVARLEILNRQLVEKSPLVTSEQVLLLESANELAAQSGKRLQEIAEKIAKL